MVAGTQLFRRPFPLSKVLLQKLHFPHFLLPTSSLVLSQYRQLLREISKCIDPLCRDYLRAFAYESIASQKYQTNHGRLKALLDIGSEDLKLLRRANRRDSKAVEEVFTRVFHSVLIKELPTKRLHGHNRCKHDLIFDINHLQAPSNVVTFQQHFANVSQKSSLYYEFVSMLEQNKLTVGHNGRKMKYGVDIEGTFLGDPLPSSREKNTIQKAYARVLQDAIYPVHPSVLGYVETCIRSPPSDLDPLSRRFYQRRLKACARELYTIERNESGRLKMIFPRVSKVVKAAEYYVSHTNPSASS